MFNATITFTNDETITLTNEKAFMKFYFDRYGGQVDKFGGYLDEWDYADIATYIYSGLMSNYDIFRIQQIFKTHTDIKQITFDAYQIKKQHHNRIIFALSKEALNRFMSMVGVHKKGVHPGATYYNKGFVWEISRTQFTI